MKVPKAGNGDEGEEEQEEMIMEVERTSTLLLLYFSTVKYSTEWEPPTCGCK